MIKGNAITLIVLSVFTLVAPLFNKLVLPEGILIDMFYFHIGTIILAATVLVFAAFALARRDNASLGVTVAIITLLGILQAQDNLSRTIFIVSFICACFLARGMVRERNRKYPFLTLNKEQIRNAQKEREEKAEAEKAEAVEKSEKEETEPGVTVITEKLGPGEEPDFTPTEKPAAEDAAPAPEEDGMPEPVPGLTEMISSEDTDIEFMTEEEWKAERYGKDDPASPADLPFSDEDMLCTANTTDEHYESPRKSIPSWPAPQVIVMNPGSDGKKTPLRVTLDSIFRRDENRFIPDEPIMTESEEGFGWNGGVKVIRYTFRNRTGKPFKYISCSVRLHDMEGITIETEEDLTIRLERRIEPGEIFTLDVPSKEYGATRGVKVTFRAAVDSRGEIYTFHHEENEEDRSLEIPSQLRLSDALGENADEFLTDYDMEYGLGFKPEYAWTTNEKGSACTCPCCGEASGFEEKKCPLCGAPRDRFVFCTVDFMKRQKERWDEKRAARLEKEAQEKARKEALERAEEERARREARRAKNRKNNAIMWSVTAVVLLFVFLAWLYWHI